MKAMRLGRAQLTPLLVKERWTEGSGCHSTRRKLLMALATAAFGAPIAAFAQQKGKVWRVGFLSQNPRPASPSDILGSGAFVRGMRDLGYVEGRNLALEGRFADGKPDRLPGLAAEVAQSKVDVIVTAGMLPALALQKATTTIPIVMIDISDPVGRGLIKSLAQPGGNITGLTNIMGDLGPSALNCCSKWCPDCHAWRSW